MNRQQRAARDRWIWQQVNRGANPATLADALNLSDRRVRQILARRGWRPPPQRVTWTPEMDAALVELRSRAVGARRAARRIGVAEQLVTRRTAELGLAAAPAGRRPRSLFNPKEPA